MNNYATINNETNLVTNISQDERSFDEIPPLQKPYFLVQIDNAVCIIYEEDWSVTPPLAIPIEVIGEVGIGYSYDGVKFTQPYPFPVTK